MRVALYARVSTADQEPENQLHVLRGWAETQGYEAEEYVDHATGRNTNRPAFRRLCSDVMRRHVGVVAVVRVDRAFRSVPDMYAVLEEWAGRGVEFVSVTQPIDTRSGLGRAFLGILAILAALESDMIADRVKDGMARAQREGKHVGRPRLRLSRDRAVRTVAECGGDVKAAALALGCSTKTVQRRMA